MPRLLTHTLTTDSWISMARQTEAFIQKRERERVCFHCLAPGSQDSSRGLRFVTGKDEAHDVFRGRRVTARVSRSQSETEEKAITGANGAERECGVHVCVCVCFAGNNRSTRGEEKSYYCRTTSHTGNTSKKANGRENRHSQTRLDNNWSLHFSCDTLFP